MKEIKENHEKMVYTLIKYIYLNKTKKYTYKLCYFQEISTLSIFNVLYPHSNFIFNLFRKRNVILSIIVYNI
jgi:hypothetical protein